MDLLRNKEVKHTTIMLSGISLFGTIAGFIIDRKTGVYGFLLCSILLSVHIFSTIKRYNKISELSNQLDMVLHGSYLLNIDDNDEGELSILKSELCKMTIRLREQADNLAKDKVYLSNSIADIAHQLRTPLTCVRLLFSRLQKSGSNAADNIALFRELDVLLVRIDWLISALLKIAKLESGTVQFKNDTVLVKNLIQKAVEPLAIAMELRAQELLCNIEPSAKYSGDFGWSVEAIGNIIKNCMEHTPPGGICNVTAVETPVYTEIILQDSGDGFCEEDLPHIFERFYKGKTSTAGNVGIGLALSKMIIENQNGTITAANSTAYKGAAFIIRFYKGAV